MAQSTSTSSSGPPLHHSPASNALKDIFHIIAADSDNTVFTAFNPHGQIFVIKPDGDAKMPRGRLNPGQSYSIKAYTTEKQEIFLTKNSKVSLFKIRFPEKKLSEFYEESEKLLKLHAIPSIATIRSPKSPETTPISAKGKVVKVGPTQTKTAIQSGNPFNLQHVRIADGNASIRVALFRSQVGKLSKGGTYVLKGVQKKTFNGRPSITVYPGAKISKTKSLMDVKEDDISDDEEMTGSTPPLDNLGTHHIYLRIGIGVGVGICCP